jgi:hypothetical protein
MSDLQRYLGLFTPFGKQVMINALNAGETIKLSYMGVGDGAGAEYTPVEGQEDLKNEWGEVEIHDISFSPNNPNWLVLEAFIKEDMGGNWIREISIKDEDRNVIVVASYPATYKPTLPEGSSVASVLRMVLQVSNTGIFEVKIDTSLIMVTRDEFIRHNNLTTDVHGSEYENIPNSIAERDDVGCLQVSQPRKANDAARLQEINDLIALMGVISETGTPIFTTHTGNGVETRFNLLGLLSDTPQAVLVYVNGSKRIGGVDYTIDLTGVSSVVFTTPPANGATIELLTMVTGTQYPMATDTIPGAVRLATQSNLSGSDNSNNVVTAGLLSGAGLYLSGPDLSDDGSGASILGAHWQLALSDTSKISLNKNTEILNYDNGELKGVNGRFNNVNAIPTLARSDGLGSSNPTEPFVPTLDGNARFYRFGQPMLMNQTVVTLTNRMKFRIGDVFYFFNTSGGVLEVMYAPFTVGTQMSGMIDVQAQTTLGLMFMGFNNGTPMFSRVV